MGSRARMTSKGQITLPKHVRERYKLKTGDIVEFVDHGSFTILQPRNGDVMELAGILNKYASVPYSVDEARAAIGDYLAEDDARITREWNDLTK